MISLALQQDRTDHVVENIVTMMRASDLGSIVRGGGDKSQVIAQDIAIHLDKAQTKRLFQRRRRSRAPNQCNEF